jgi:chromosome segregation ATPase
LRTRILDITRVKDEQATSLHDTNQSLQATIDEKNDFYSQLSELKTQCETIQRDLSKAAEAHLEEISQLNAVMQQKDVEGITLNEHLASLNSRFELLHEELATVKFERDDIANKLESTVHELFSKKEEVSKYSVEVSNFEASIEALRNERDMAVEKMNEILACNGVAEEVLSSLKSEKDELAFEWLSREYRRVERSDQSPDE